MRAVQLSAYDTKPELAEVPDPHADGALDVVVKIGGAGVCRTDLHIIEGQWEQKSGVTLPYTIGHENAGWVEEIGERGDVGEGRRPGDPASARHLRPVPVLPGR